MNANPRNVTDDQDKLARREELIVDVHEGRNEYFNANAEGLDG